MSESLEIEYKTLLSHQNYQKLIQHYQLTDQDFFSQTNAYYDTPDEKLKQTNWGLRIRTYSDHAEATLKTPAAAGRLETTDEIPLATAQALVSDKKFLATGSIITKLTELNIASTDLIQFAQLTTKRAEFKIPEGLLAIDHSFYSNQEDYELELEVADATQGKLAFQQLLKELAIPLTPGKNKIKRAYYAARKTN